MVYDRTLWLLRRDLIHVADPT